MTDDRLGEIRNTFFTMGSCYDSTDTGQTSLAHVDLSSPATTQPPKIRVVYRNVWRVEVIAPPIRSFIHSFIRSPVRLFCEIYTS